MIFRQIAHRPESIQTCDVQSTIIAIVLFRIHLLPDFFDLKSENNVPLGVKIFHENIRGRNVCGLSKWIVITMCDRNRGMVEKRKTNGQKAAI